MSVRRTAPDAKRLQEIEERLAGIREVRQVMRPDVQAASREGSGIALPRTGYFPEHLELQVEKSSVPSPAPRPPTISADFLERVRESAMNDNALDVVRRLRTSLFGTSRRAGTYWQALCTSLDPYLITFGLLDLASDPTEPDSCIDAGEFALRVLHYFHWPRRGLALPMPNESELAEAFGDAHDIVARLWHCIRFLDKVDKTRNDGSVAPDERVRREFRLREEARTLLLIRTPVERIEFEGSTTTDDRANARRASAEERWLVETLCRWIADAIWKRSIESDPKRQDLQELVKTVRDRHISTDNFVLNFEPRGEVKSILGYLRNTAKWRAIDTLRSGKQLIQSGVVAVGEGKKLGIAETGHAGMPVITPRGQTGRGGRSTSGQRSRYSPNLRELAALTGRNVSVVGPVVSEHVQRARQQGRILEQTPDGTILLGILKREIVAALKEKHARRKLTKAQQGDELFSKGLAELKAVANQLRLTRTEALRIARQLATLKVIGPVTKRGWRLTPRDVTAIELVMRGNVSALEALVDSCHPEAELSPRQKRALDELRRSAR